MKRILNYIYLAFGVSIIVIVVVASLLSDKISMMIYSSGWVEHTHEVKNQIQKVQLDLLKAESTQREYLLTENESLLRPLRETQKSVFKEIDSLQLLTKDNKEQQDILAKLKKVVSLRYQILYQTINSEKEDQLGQFLSNAAKGNQAMADFMALLTQMDEAETKLLHDRTKNRIISQNEVPKYLILILIISCVFQIISFLIIIKAFKKRAEYESMLENKIKELNVANAEMEQITFVASHDLQEPLRKIRTFSDKLLNHYAKLDEEGEMIIGKISVASKRMQELLNDLISYSRITKNEEIMGPVDLRLCIKKVCEGFGKTIEEKGAVLKIGELPVIDGYQQQMFTLFSNLVDNALKFSKPTQAVLIKIDAQKAAGTEVGSEKDFWKISFSDNGTGFKKEYADKIFVIFQRLLNNDSSIPGKGIGLAICKRIMINHHGYITAEGETNIGATINLYFPENS